MCVLCIYGIYPFRVMSGAEASVILYILSRFSLILLMKQLSRFSNL